MKIKFLLNIVVFICILNTGPFSLMSQAQAHGEEGSVAASSPPAHHHEENAGGVAVPQVAPTPNLEVRVEEKLGDRLPLDLSFVDENGKTIILKELFDKPVLLVPIFYACTRSCAFMLANIAQIIPQMPDAGKDFRIISFSINDEETPELAKERKNNYIKLAGEGFPRSEWTFLLGSKENIYKITDSLGFYFKKVGKNNFQHPNVQMALDPTGKIIRYLYGNDVLAADVRMAMLEAHRGTPGISIRKFLSYCILYDQNTKNYSYKYVKIFGYSLFGLLAVFILWIIFGRTKKQINLHKH